MMNGPVSLSMRQKGLNYRLNFGVELPRLQRYAEALPRNPDLAEALWGQDVRECRLLAGILMPHDKFTPDMAERWTTQIRFPEEADCTVFHLLQHLPYASEKAFAWMASEKAMTRYLGYQLLTRLLIRNKRLTTRDAHELMDHTTADLTTPEPDTNVQRAAVKCLLRFMECGIGEQRMGQRVLDRLAQTETNISSET